MEHIVGPIHHISDRVQVSDITYVELDLGTVIGILRLQCMSHPVLLLFITGDDTDFSDIRGQEVLENG